jgi:hypothetical protein
MKIGDRVRLIDAYPDSAIAGKVGKIIRERPRWTGTDWLVEFREADRRCALPEDALELVSK